MSHFDTNEMYPLHFYIFLTFFHIILINTDKIEDDIEFYTKLIESNIQESLKYEQPVNANEYKPNTNEVKEFGKYDFIIIGGGTSGSVLAGRLAKISKYKILVLEAGTFENKVTDIPNMFLLESASKYNWGFMSTPQTSCCLGMQNKRCPYPRGKGFGGTSIIDALIYSRGNKMDYNRWEKQGNPSWNYNNILKYFIKSENSSIKGDVGYHGKSGPLEVQYPSLLSLQTQKFIEANNELGIKTIDINGAQQLGVSRINTNIRDGNRLSTYKAFLRPEICRKNLQLLPDSYVTKLYINETTNRREVYFSRYKQSYVVKANKEIILSAGTINSAQILMLSGIGPADHLEELGIPLVKNLSVGNNLQDHPAYFGSYFITNHSESTKPVREYVKEYLEHIGFYTVAGNVQALGYYETPDNLEKGYPDVELLMASSPLSFNFLPRILMLTNETAEDVFKSLDPSCSFFVCIILLRPESKGTIRLKSKDPYEYPLIDSCFLCDKNENDIKKIYDTIQFLRKLQETKAFKSIDAKYHENNLSGCKCFEKSTKKYWYCVIRHLTMNIFHPVGTNKMGPNPNDGDVVDVNFRVHGFKTLRIVDASIFPFSFAGHPVASCIMIGEKAYDLITQEYT